MESAVAHALKKVISRRKYSLGPQHQDPKPDRDARTARRGRTPGPKRPSSWLWAIIRPEEDFAQKKLVPLPISEGRVQTPPITSPSEDGPGGGDKQTCIFRYIRFSIMKNPPLPPPAKKPFRRCSPKNTMVTKRQP